MKKMSGPETEETEGEEDVIAAGGGNAPEGETGEGESES